MSKIDLEFVARSRQVFANVAGPTLADLRGKATAGLTGIARRDTLSAFDAIAKKLGQELSQIPATRRAVRILFQSKSAAQIGFSSKRYANIRSLVIRAVETFDAPHVPITRRILLAAEWRRLLAPLPKVDCFPLYRLAAFCSEMQTAPGAVNSGTLLAFFAALEAEEHLKNPKAILQNAIVTWNRLHRRCQHWPRHTLGLPFVRPKLCLPLSDFPSSFQKDLATWKNGLLYPDPFDDNHVRVALRPVTAGHHEKTLIRFASALVLSRTLDIAKVADLSVLVTERNIKAGLRVYLDRFEGKTNTYIGAIARVIVSVAKYYCGVSGKELKALKALMARMQPPPKRDWLTKRNHRRLEQFDDKKNVMALLTYPQAERARALETRDPKRRAASFERALIAALFIHAKLRIQSLRTLELKDFRKGNGGETFLFVPGEKIKTGAPLEFALPEYVSELLEEYKRDYRRQMPGAKGPYLFPGLDGKPRYHSSIRHGLSKSLRKHAGLDMNPHLFRHALTKIIVERNPELALALSRQLGHRSIETTMRYYMGTEQRAAGRHLDRVLLDLQQRGKAV